MNRGRARVREGKENKPLIIYLRDTSSSTFISGQWCTVTKCWAECCVVRGRETLLVI